jgi:hypothetical protein
VSGVLCSAVVSATENDRPVPVLHQFVCATTEQQQWLLLVRSTVSC